MNAMHVADSMLAISAQAYASESRLKPLPQNQWVAIADWAKKGIKQRFLKPRSGGRSPNGQPVEYGEPLFIIG